MSNPITPTEDKSGRRDDKDDKDDEGPDCEYMDWDCVDEWAADNADKLPCKLEDEGCWMEWLKENPPCDDDDVCW